ncbi:hypothetical protein NDU88_002650 [Pleurodeles waltl]|uniref:Uncharacterized protein n=1 Tax=Pleurodeles waltl TaxID=8319 RepID=A0AAV7M4S9_PLEWA|nr:hypothetical protein NDU88_002650 [Pleurodeles waltl]
MSTEVRKKLTLTADAIDGGLEARVLRPAAPPLVGSNVRVHQGMVFSVVQKVLSGSQIGRWKADERPPSLSAGEDSAGVRRVSVAVEAKEDVGKGAARLVKGIYVSDMGVTITTDMLT